jgi:hypothetical protein
VSIDSSNISERASATARVIDGPRDPLAPEAIDCIDCGGTCHLLTRPDDTGRFWPGDLLTYRCADCGDRWDLIVPDDSEER